MQYITRGLQQAKNVQGEKFNQDQKKLGDFIGKHKDRPAWTPNVVFVVVSYNQRPSYYSFALTSMSFRDLPLL